MTRPCNFFLGLVAHRGRLDAVSMMGSAVKAIGVWVSLFLLSIVAYSGISNLLSGTGQPLSESRASPSITPAPPSRNTSVGAIAREASSGTARDANKPTAMPAAGSTNDGNNLAANLSEYVFLHKTRHEIVASPPATRACPE